MNDKFLTPDGRERRSRILQLAIGEASRHRRRRWIARSAAAMIVVAVIGIASLRTTVRPQTVLRPVRVPVAVIPPPPAATQPSVAIEYLATDPTITDRLSIKPEPPRWTSIDDDELLAELAAAGKPAGLAYVNGRPILLMRK
jgi:hypothetical protein